MSTRFAEHRNQSNAGKFPSLQISFVNFETSFRFTHPLNYPAWLQQPSSVRVKNLNVSSIHEACERNVIKGINLGWRSQSLKGFVKSQAPL